MHVARLALPALRPRNYQKLLAGQIVSLSVLAEALAG